MANSLRVQSAGDPVTNLYLGIDPSEASVEELADGLADGTLLTKLGLAGMNIPELVLAPTKVFMLIALDIIPVLLFIASVWNETM